MTHAAPPDGRQGQAAACFEEAEAAVALAGLVLRDPGTDAATLAREAERIRSQLG